MIRSRPLLAVWVLLLVYGAYFSALSIQRHAALLTHASDLGQIDQAVWNTLQGRLLEVTRREGAQLPRLTDHVEPVFIPLSLLFLIYNGVESLLVVQSFVIGLGALPVYWIARRELGRSHAWAAVTFSALYLLFPALEAANLAEFHPIALAPAPLLFAYHYGLEKRWGLFALCASLALATQETIAPLVLTTSAYFAWRSLLAQPGRKFGLSFLVAPLRAPQTRIPLLFAALSLGWFVLAWFVIIPHFARAGNSPYNCRYIVAEDCPQAVRALQFPERLGYLGQLFASSGLAALFNPAMLLLGLPFLAANLLSNYPAQYSGAFHYSAPVAPYFVLASIGGSARLIRRLAPRLPSSSRAYPIVLGPLFLIALGYHLLAGYTPVAAGFVWPALTPHDLLLTRFTQSIPPSAIISVTPSLHPHLSHRQFIYRYPVAGFGGQVAGSVLLDVSESFHQNPIDFRVAYDGLLDAGYGVADASDGYILLSRDRAGRVTLPDEFFSLFRANHPPQVQVGADFGDALRLLGYDLLNDPFGRVSFRFYWRRLRPLGGNLNLFPFFVGPSGEPRADLALPPATLLFWYPTSAWSESDIVTQETLPVDAGPLAQVGLGVLDGDDWSDNQARLPVRLPSTSSFRASPNNTWLQVATVRKVGSSYQLVPVRE